MNRFLVVPLILSSILLLGFVDSFQSSIPSRAPSACKKHSTFTTTTTKRPQPFVSSTTQRECELFGGIFDDIGGFMKRFTTKATASHILMKGGAEAENKLEDLKAEIGNSPVKFAEAAAKYSACPSASKGGDLGEFGPGAMVKEFDQVVFKDEVGVVHGPIKTQFGYHLIFINERTE
jgi:peptidyl-prolyl cis-trans isomerase C